MKFKITKIWDIENLIGPISYYGWFIGKILPKRISAICLGLFFFYSAYCPQSVYAQSIQFLSVSPKVVNVGEPVQIIVKVRNSGSTTINNLWLGFDIYRDGTKVDNTKTPIPDEAPPAGTGKIETG